MHRAPPYSNGAIVEAYYTSIWQSKHPTKICNAEGGKGRVGEKVLMKMKGANHVMKRA